MNRIKIGSTEVFLENYKKGQGKIIISDIYNGSFTYYWGAMGCNIEEFIKSINEDYFIGKLTTNDNVFCPKKSTTMLRKAIRDEFRWYEYMSAQKELREYVKDIETTSTEYEFIDVVSCLPNRVICYDLDKYDEKDFKDRLESILTEPWYYIDYKPSQEYLFLSNLHKKLKQKL